MRVIDDLALGGGLRSADFVLYNYFFVLNAIPSKADGVNI